MVRHRRGGGHDAVPGVAHVTAAKFRRWAIAGHIGLAGLGLVSPVWALVSPPRGSLPPELYATCALLGLWAAYRNIVWAFETAARKVGP